MVKLADQPLEDLYARDKITPATIKAIKEKEDFSQIRPRYCEAVCQLKCKSYNQQHVNSSRANVVMIQDHHSFKSGWKSAEQEERHNQRVISALTSKYFKNVSSRVINVMKCLPDERATGSKKKPAETMLLRCSPYALQEIENCKPKVIICMSTPGLKMLGLKASIFNERGEIHYYKGIPVVVTLHPKYIMMIRQSASGKMWGPDFLEVLERDFEKARRLLKGDLVVPDLDESIKEVEKNQIHICRSLKEVSEFMATIEKHKDKVISFDLETTSLDPWSEDARILTAQFGVRLEDGLIHAYVIPLWHRENSWVYPDKAWDLILPLFTDKYVKTGHNLKFDVLYTFVTKGVRVKGIAFDTMLHLHDMNSGIQGNYGLKRGVWDFLPETGLGGYEDKLPKLTKK